MKFAKTEGVRRLALGAAAVLLAACGGGNPGSGALEQPQSSKSVAAGAQQIAAAAQAESDTGRSAARGLYIVQLADNPALGYTGDIAGYQATKPGKGKKLDPNSPAVVNYVDMLTRKHDAALGGVGGKKAYSYVYAFNGFAAELSEQQAAQLAAAPGVLAIVKNEMRELDTSSTPEFLGLAGDAGFWNRTGAKGEGVIIGVVDGGVWPEHPSYDDRTDVNGNGTKDGKLGYQQLPGWNGKCTPGDAFNASHCNQKLIGARYYNQGFGGNAGIATDFPWEFNSPRDYGGHGTHTSTTAGGNAGVPATGDAAVFGRITGIAPRARIAAYKACWETGAGGLCPTVDTMAAIDQAVADGVDVINYSIGGSRTNFRDPIAIAFLFAADAGVFVAASSGNSGPTSSTVAHPGPWMTTVANGSHNRTGLGSITTGDGTTHNGSSLALALGSTPLIDAVNAAAAGASAADAERCFVGTLDAAKVAGKIVLCKRGVSALVDKTGTVKAAGGVGAVIYNDPAGATNTLALLHVVPTVHVVATAGTALKAYAAAQGAAATGAIAKAEIVLNAPAPITATSSSRGPLIAGGGDLLKPDLIAPGSEVLAGVAPPGNGGQSFALYSGTSMASPHVAGIAALFKELKPDWSPMAVKSALMTSAGDILDGPNTNPLVIFRQGAGHVNPNGAVDPGVVFETGFADWLAFICKAQPGGGCTGVTPLDDLSNLNVPSIAIGDLADSQTVTRRVRNVSGKKITLSAALTGMTGITTTVTPSTLTLDAGETKSFTVAFKQVSAAFNAYTGGQLTWSGDGYRVRSPIVVRPVALIAPAEVSAGASGVTNYNVTFAYTGAFTATPRGVIPAAVTPGNVSGDPTTGACDLNTPNAAKVAVAIASGTSVARFALFDADSNAGSDIDMCVVNSAGTVVGGSGGATSAEQVTLLAPAAGNYTVVIQGFSVGAGSPFKLHTWLLGTANAGNMTVTAPASATVNATAPIGLSFTGLEAGKKYMGSVAYGGVAGLPGPTLVRVDP